ncbi:MAG: phosphopantetheine-binding protein [Thermodesulfobacteriota bacterium]
MTETEIISRTNAALAQEFELDPEAMVPAADLREDLGLDSLDAVDMVIVLEQEFGVKISKESAIGDIRSLGDLYAFIAGVQEKQKQ